MIPLPAALVEPAFPSSPPISIDDAETVERGHAEINLTLGLSGKRRGWESEAPLLDGNYGLSDNVHINAEIPLVEGNREGARGLGAGQAAVALKVRVIHKDRVQLAFHPAIELPALPRLAYDPGGGLSVTLPMVVDFGVGQGGAGVGLQLAHTFVPGEPPGSWSMALGVAHPLGGGALMLDATEETDGGIHPGDAALEVGYVRDGILGWERVSGLCALGLSSAGEASGLLGIQVGL